jgi:hypothetical protein
MIYPDLSGTWNFQIVSFRRTDPTQPPSFSNINTSQSTVTIQQKDNFIIIDLPAVPPEKPTEAYYLGLISEVYNNINNFWQVTLADSDDTGIANLTIKEYESECNCDDSIVIFPTVLEGYYVESGFSPLNPNQNQAVSRFTFTRIQ